MKFVVVDRCPVPAKAAPFVVEAKRRSGQSLNSCFRGIEARAILARYGKHDQVYLYNGWIRHLPGFNPANPPKRSTHECYNDGPAFPSRAVGARIPDELVGQDWTNAWKVVAAYRAMGINAALTYPTSALEKQHVNIRVIPKKLPVPLKRGDGKVKGHNMRRRVNRMTGRLSYLNQPNGKGRYLTGRRNMFDAETELAVKHFQHDHGLRADGIVGEMTEHQIDVSYAATYKRRHKKKPTKKPPTHAPSHPEPAKKLTLQGVDVSMHQGDVDWHQVKASGIDFAIVKATEGLDFHDPTFSTARVKAMRRAGLRVGYYHFARPQPGRTGTQEAQFFLRVVRAATGLKAGDLAPVLDIEWVQGLGQKQLVAWVRAFVKECERQTGVKPIIYTGAWFWNPRTGEPKRAFKRHALWLAAYVKDPAPFVPASFAGWTIWQHSDKGHVGGIATPCDVNTFRGTTADLKRITLH